MCATSSRFIQKIVEASMMVHFFYCWYFIPGDSDLRNVLSHTVRSHLHRCSKAVLLHILVILVFLGWVLSSESSVVQDIFV